MKFAAEKQFISWSTGKLGEGIHNPFQSCVVPEIRQKLHLPNGYYDSFKEKEDNLQRALS